MARISSALLLAAAALPSQSPNLQPARLLPGGARIGPAPEVQQNVAAAAGSTATLVVFEDRRAGDSDLFAVRLDATGTAIDALPFPVAKDPGEQRAPKVVWNGQDWLVVYSNQVDPGSGYFAYQVAARRVSAQGAVRDAAPLALAMDDSGGSFAVASDGSGWVVAYTGFSAGNSGIHARRVRGDGTVLDPGGVLVAPATYYLLSDIQAAFAGGHYLLAWGDTGLRVRRFTPTLQPIDVAPVLVHGVAARLAGNGAGCLLAWSAQNAQFQGEVYGARLGADLTLLDPVPLRISGATANDNHVEPRLVWDGSQWIVGWQHRGTLALRAARVAADGRVLDFGGVAIATGAPSYLYSPATGALPTGGAIVAWHDPRHDANDVFGTTFSATGVSGVERCLSLGSETLQAPRVAAGDQQYLVTCRALAATGSRILAQRVDAFGLPLDAEPIEVAAASHRQLSAGSAAWNGAVYLVVWSDATLGQVYGRRMRADGSFLDATPIAVLLGGGADVAALGDDFLVTAIRAPGNPQYVFSYGARVRGRDGTVLDTPALGIGNSYATRARVVVLGSRWCVVTERHWTHDQNQSSVEVAFVDAAGAVSAGPNAANVNIQDWGSTDVASAGTSALIVCQSGSNWTNTDLFVRRLLPDGTLTGTLANVTAVDPGGQSRACVAWTGAEYVLAYQSLQNNVWFYDFEPDVYGLRVAESGAPVDTTGFALWAGEDWERSPDVAGLGLGRALFAAATYVDDGQAAFRIATRELRPDGLASFGTGTAGCAGVQRLFATGAPRLGDAAFALLCDRTPPGLSGGLLLGAAPDVAGTLLPALGLRLHIDAARPYLALPMTADGSGLGRTGVPIPSLPGLRGMALHGQAIWAWGASCPLPPLGLSASLGLSMVLQ